MFSLQQSFVWIRFPIYAVAIQTWLGKRNDFREIMLIFIFIGMMLMNLILITELILEPKHRLTWPYGDQFLVHTWQSFVCQLCAFFFIFIIKIFFNLF